MLAEVALSAGDGEGYDDPVAHLELFDAGTDLDDLAHELVSQDVALLHRRDVAVQQVQVRAADGGRRDPDDGVLRVQQFRVGYAVDPHVVATVPNERPHYARPDV